jgi:hypothetical protein
MSTINLPDGRIQLEAWGIAEFLREFQPLHYEGWYVDFEENDGYPVNIGGLVHAKLTKTTQDEFVEENEVEVQTKVEKPLESVVEPSDDAPVKRGRPAKS